MERCTDPFEPIAIKNAPSIRGAPLVSIPPKARTENRTEAGTSTPGTSMHETLPSKIKGTYQRDYNILHVDTLIRKKLRQDQIVNVTDLRKRLVILRQSIHVPQTYVNRQTALNDIKMIEAEIEATESGQHLAQYDARTQEIIASYRKCSRQVKTIMFDMTTESEYQEMDSDFRYRISLIERYLEIAADYIEIDIVRIDNTPSDRCNGCGISLALVAINEDGTRRCPECFTEHDVLIMAKLAKDGSRINTTSSADDETIDNFMKAFIRKQALQNDRPDDSIYAELDAYFALCGRPSGEEIRAMPLTERGRRGDTNHKMLFDALSRIGHRCYEDADLIGKIYWGWELKNYMHLQERIRTKYYKTQKVFCQIPPEERDRSSSLGTQYRLWRHLQLEGVDCYVDEFKIAENPDSLRTHNRVWRLMCEGAKDPEIYYIP